MTYEILKKITQNHMHKPYTSSCSRELFVIQKFGKILWSTQKLLRKMYHYNTEDNEWCNSPRNCENWTSSKNRQGNIYWNVYPAVFWKLQKLPMKKATSENWISRDVFTFRKNEVYLHSVLNHLISIMCKKYNLFNFSTKPCIFATFLHLACDYSYFI